MNIPNLGLRKERKRIFPHIFCNEFMNPFCAMQIVGNPYKKFNLGKPIFRPAEPNRIYTIPLPGADLTQ